MTHFVLHDFAPKPTLDMALIEVEYLGLRRYDNPFECKSFLEDKAECGEALASLFGLLLGQDMIRTVQRLLDLPIQNADYWHYGGLFVYEPGDYLAPHVDAGIHPTTKQRKVATACLYLTPAVLSFWAGDSCTQDDPEVWLEEPHLYKPNDCVLFANDDSAWHSVPTTTKKRVVLTVSYMAHSTFDRQRYKNKRTRAYFARRHGVSDTPEMAALRQQRASEEHHAGVYRI